MIIFQFQQNKRYPNTPLISTCFRKLVEDVIAGNLKDISIVTMDRGCSGDNQLQDTIVANVSTKA